jgi:hypothetical protein
MTVTVETRECARKALVANGVKIDVVCPSSDVAFAMSSSLCFGAVRTGHASWMM